MEKQKKARKTKLPAKPRLTAEQRRDWKSLPYAEWNVMTLISYFVDKNRECYGVDEYLPMRNWAFEQGVLKRSLAEHGAELLHAAFDECFRTYRPTREFPLLTAGFAVAYRINGILPRLKVEMTQRAEMAVPVDVEAVKAWL